MYSFFPPLLFPFAYVIHYYANALSQNNGGWEQVAITPF